MNDIQITQEQPERASASPNRLDRLYHLLPAIYRMRDAEKAQGYALRALLRVISTEVNAVEDNIRQLYDDLFIETAQDWVVPYIGDLIGYRPVHEAGEPGDPATPQARTRNKILIPRREVANTIRYRRRKGTLALLEELAFDVAGWPARAVEFYKLLGWTQNINYLQPARAHLADLRNNDALDLLNGPFDAMAHTVDVRRIGSARNTTNAMVAQGRYNIPSIGVFVWRLKTYSVTQTPAYCAEDVDAHFFTFSALGNDVPLYVKPVRETEPTHIAEEANLPVPIRRRELQLHPQRYYGADKSFAIWVGSGDDAQPRTLVPLKNIVVADLSDWQYVPKGDEVAVDPERGRIAFPISTPPENGVWVSYQYAFSANIGGGDYERPLSQPDEFTLLQVGTPITGVAGTDSASEFAYTTVQAAIEGWNTLNPRPKNVVIELADNGVYTEQIRVVLRADERLQIRAANGKRPIIRLIDWRTNLPDALSITLSEGSQVTLDGLLITGRAVNIRGKKGQDTAQAICPAEVTIRHCTLVPGWGLHNDCHPRRPTEPSLELMNVRAAVTIEHSVLGPIQVNENQVTSDPIPIAIRDSIVDAMDGDSEAVGAPDNKPAHAVLTVQRSTVLGMVQVHAIDLAENSIFMDCLHVARRQRGCMRFCYVPPNCRTPRRYHCQADLAEQAGAVAVPAAQRDAARVLARERVRPQFASVLYGTPGYCQLSAQCAEEIKRGADDESEIGVFHDLYQPQRTANLRARLDEFTPAGMQAGIIFVED